MKLKKLVINIAVIVVSIGVGLLICEIGSRMVLNPADYLTVKMVRDPVLGRTPSSTTKGGFDALGFRNRSVPATADIVAIGDSQTYGNAATMDDSWPYALGRAMGRPVYNMALGGYGPNQYLELLTTKALGLKPRMVICGLSVTDDFDNAYQMTYGLDYWAYLRVLPGVKVDFDTWDTDPAKTRQKKMREWLSQHSVVYQLVVHTGIGDRLKGDLQIRNAASLYPGAATSLVIPEKHIEEAFRPVENLRGLDQESKSVREGMRITFELLGEMNEICRKNNIQFVVVVLPTKDMVFAQYL
ncbi:MAG: SGNH/GDSL hydrolase family protein, partial [Candidatus Binatia bacterium]